MDTARPEIATVDTGIRYDHSTRGETEDRRWHKAAFQNEGIGGIELLDPSTVHPGSFHVSEGHVVVSVVHPNRASGLGGVIETRNAVYIELAEELRGDETPTVSLVSPVADLAGNLSSLHSRQAHDSIAPRLVVTMTGQVETSGRAIARGVSAGEDILIRVTSDEPLNGAPSVVAQRFAYDSRSDAAINGVKVASVHNIAVAAVPGLADTWEASVGAVDVGGAGLFGIWASATDFAGNHGVTGSGGGAVNSHIASEQAVDFTKAHLGEFINDLGIATVTVTPGANGVTESPSPFLRIDFSQATGASINTRGNAFPSTTAPAGVFDCGAPSPGASARCMASPGHAGQVGASPARVDLGVQMPVELISITLDDQDVFSEAGSVDEDAFVLAASGLTLGKHTLAFNARDVLGNTHASAQVFTFTLQERTPYEVPLSPGWNLISLPGTSQHSDIDAVLPPEHPATAVLTFMNGVWSTATRGANGKWEGTITHITGAHAYWVQSNAFTSIRTLIPDRVLLATLPALPVHAGWNLLPVMDFQQAPAGGPPGGNAPRSALDYFAGINWNVAYTFDTLRNIWTRITPLSGASVRNGTGYWVYVLRDGFLVP